MAQLSARQIACLRALREEGSTKAVADRLGIAPGTVDQHLKAARRTLGVSDSWAAARLLEASHLGTIQKLDTQALVVANAPIVETSAPGSDGNARSDEKAEPNGVRRLRDLLVPPLRRKPNDLTISERFGIIAIQILISASGVAVLAIALILLSRFLLTLNQKGG